MAENRYSVLVPIAGAVHVVVTAADEKGAIDEALEEAGYFVGGMSEPDCGVGSLDSLEATTRDADGRISYAPTRLLVVKKLKEGE